NNRLELNEGIGMYDEGAWATSLRYSEQLGKFYLLVNIQDGVSPEYATLSVADCASGPWTVYRLNDKLYDPGLFFDEDSKIYVIHGQGQLYISELEVVDQESGELKISDTLHNQKFYNYTGGYYNEGSHVYKIDGVYYILSTPTWDYADTGTKKEIAIQTRDLLNGPYEVRDIMTSYMNFEKNGIHQGGIVDVPQENGDAEWWSIIFLDHHKIGRMPTLQPVTWEIDEKGLKWPMLGMPGTNGEHAVVTYRKPQIRYNKSIMPINPMCSDHFETGELATCWQWNHVPDDNKWSLTERPGYMRLYTASVTESLTWARNTLRQRVVGPESMTTIKLDIEHMADGDVAGLTVFKKHYNFIGVQYDQEKSSLSIVVNDDGQVVISENLPKGTKAIWLQVRIPRFEYRVEYYYSLEGEHFTRLGGRYEMQYIEPYVGMGIGVFNYATKALGGYVDMEFFDMHMPEQQGNYFKLGAKIEAENYDDISYGVTAGTPSRKYNPQTVYTSDYVYNTLLHKEGMAYDRAVSNLKSGDWIQYNRVDFGEGADWFNARISGVKVGGKIEVHKDSPEGKLLGTLNVPHTGNAEVYQNVEAKMTARIIGTNRIHLVYQGPENSCQINWFMFGIGSFPQIPEVPRVMGEMQGPTQMKISWGKIKCAREYDIELSNGISTQRISNAKSPFVQTGLQEGMSYTIRVRSKNEGGYSEWSVAFEYPGIKK
ncbi:MAG: carbohydrate-binding protein, partial [Cellulosilyticaceae bacterium]